MDRASFSCRLWALAILVPIACGWGWFISSTPIFRWNIQRSHDASRVVLGDYLFDFSSQTAKPFADDGTAASLFPQANGRSFRVHLENLSELQKEAKGKGGVSSAVKLRVTGYDHRESKMVHDFDTSIEDQPGAFYANQWIVLIPTGIASLEQCRASLEQCRAALRLNSAGHCESMRRKNFESP